MLIRHLAGKFAHDGIQWHLVNPTFINPTLSAIRHFGREVKPPPLKFGSIVRHPRYVALGNPTFWRPVPTAENRIKTLFCGLETGLNAKQSPQRSHHAAVTVCNGQGHLFHSVWLPSWLRALSVVRMNSPLLKRLGWLIMLVGILVFAKIILAKL